MDIPPRAFNRRVLELWDYEYNPFLQAYERVSFRALHVDEPAENPPDVFHDMRTFYSGMPVHVQRRIDFSTMPPPSPPGVLPAGPPPQSPRVPPPRPPPPNFGQRREEASAKSPDSPDPSEPYSPDTPTKRMRSPSPPWSPDRLHCDRSLYVARQDHQFALPPCCPDHPETPPANPALQPRPEPRRQRRRAPLPPRRGRGRGILRPIPVRPGTQQQGPPVSFQRVRNLFSDFVPNILPPSPPMVNTFPGPRTPSPELEPLPPSRTPSPDVFQEVYSHTRHPVDERSHLTIVPSWAMKADQERDGECIICYGEDSHLQIKCKNCSSQKVCCVCVIGVYQSINSCPTCRFRGEY